MNTFFFFPPCCSQLEGPEVKYEEVIFLGETSHRWIWHDIAVSTLGIFRVEELVVLQVDGISLT